MSRQHADRRHARQEAASILKAVLEAVEKGELAAATPQARRLLRRIEGAVVALEATENPKH